VSTRKRHMANVNLCKFFWYQREQRVQETFMHVIKTVRCDWSIVFAAPPIQFLTLALYKFIYLLTYLLTKFLVPLPETCHKLTSDFWSKKLSASFWYTWPFDSLYSISYGCSICTTSTV